MGTNFDKCDPKKQKYKQELTPNAKYQQFRVFVRNDLVKRKIKSYRKSSKTFLKFKKKLGLDINVVPCDEQDIISTLQTAFEGKTILTQYCIENKRIDAYFSKYKLALELMNIIMKTEILIMKKQAINDRGSWNYYY